MNTIKATNKAKKPNTPQVGIFWIYKSRIFHAETVAVENDTRYGDAIGGNADHADTWEKLRSCGKLSKLPENLRDEYFSIPRGCVVYYTDTQRYTFCMSFSRQNKLKLYENIFACQRIYAMQKQICTMGNMCDGQKSNSCKFRKIPTTVCVQPAIFVIF